MNKRDFQAFVAKTLDELRLYAEIHADKSISGEIEFRWLRKDCEWVVGKEDIIKEIVRLIFVSEDLIYPCCDLNIMELTNEGNLRIEGWIANFEPRKFQNGWSGRPGPFIYCVYEKFINPSLDTESESFKSKLIELGLIKRQN